MVSRRVMVGVAEPKRIFSRRALGRWVGTVGFDVGLGLQERRVNFRERLKKDRGRRRAPGPVESDQIRIPPRMTFALPARFGLTLSCSR